ncbi:MAG TPA: EamA family transporter [Pyrinomonadaceae bacterium]|jgi:drug/metabolite transporter (DMT)-like permease|nr:EamA family transporter [Pyrinomonadaceae bacterium]
MKSRLVWLLLCLIWGSTWLFIKLGLDDLPPFIFAGVRFVIAAAILFVIIKARRLTLPRARADWVLLAITGVLSFSFNYGLVFWGEQYVSSGLAALLQAMIPAFGLVIAHFYLPGERMTTVKILGIVMGVAGVGVVFSNQLTVAGTRALAGCGALVFGSACAAYANVLVKARGGKLDPAILAGGQMVFGLVPLLLVGFLTEANPLQLHWSRMAVIALFYLAIVGSVIAFLSYYWLVQHMDVTNTMLIALVTPVIAVALGVIVLHEELNWRTFAGGAMIIAGIGLVVLRKSRKPTAELTPAG